MASQHMYSLMKRDPDAAPIRTGFHAVPSMDHLHMHIIVSCC
jgi:hypothetical protein